MRAALRSLSGVLLSGMLLGAAMGCAPAPSRESVVERSPALALSAQPDDRLAALGPAALPDADLTTLVAQATTIAKEHCGSCHGDDTHAGKPDALAVFDLRQAGWYRRLDDAQLDVAISRLKDKGTEQQRTRFGAFVEKLRARRKDR